MGIFKGSVYLVLLVNVISVFSAHIGSETANVEARTKVVVETTTGLVQGEVGGVTARLHKTWYRFRGIPFAEPPVGSNRFEPPVPIKPWQGVLDSSTRGAECIQGTDPLIGSEDCLFLKVYTPKTPNKRNKLPVLVWIYGGAFYTGAAHFDNSNPEPLLEENVIVVGLHYRLGIFGFLSTGDSVAPGNNGLKDQILALRWIKDNILNFGGDPNKITIFGQSAGGASISYLLQDPQTAGLYSGAVMLSGHSLNSWALTREPLEFAQNIASSLKVTTANTKSMVEGLKKISAADIQKATQSRYTRTLASNPLGGLPLGPVVEPSHTGAVITGRSHDLLKNGQFNKVPIMIGHTSLEARNNDELSSAIRLLLTTFTLAPGRFVPIGVNIANPIRRNNVGRKIQSHYFGGSAVSSEDIKVLKWISDDQFVRGVHEAVRLYAKQVPVFYYDFAYEGPLFGVSNRTISGVGHTEDLGYLFDFGYVGSQKDYLIRERYVRLITNFAKYQNPTPRKDALLQNFEWTANSANHDIRVLNITDKLEIVTSPYSNNVNFWSNLFHTYAQASIDTY